MNCKRPFDFTDTGDLIALGAGLLLGAVAILIALWIGRLVDKRTRP